MQFSFVFSLLSFVGLSVARPLGPSSSSVQGDVDKIRAIENRHVNNYSPFSHSPWLPHAQAHLSDLHLPPASLPLPTPSNKLIHIALGRGTQNYSCPLTANSSTIPTSTGAIATLYNITSLRLHASTGQNSLLDALVDGSTLTSYALSLANPNGMSSTTNNGTNTKSDCDKRFSALNLDLSGHHYFSPSISTSAPPIPHFDLSSIGIGRANAAKNGSVTAPVAGALSIISSPFDVTNSTRTNTNATASTSASTSIIMPATDVPWLYLRALNINSTISGGTGTGEQQWKEVYRVNTRGGVVPASCVGLEGRGFVVEYAAEYWFFG